DWPAAEREVEQGAEEDRRRVAKGEDREPERVGLGEDGGGGVAPGGGGLGGDHQGEGDHTQAGAGDVNHVLAAGDAAESAPALAFGGDVEQLDDEVDRD